MIRIGLLEEGSCKGCIRRLQLGLRCIILKIEKGNLKHHIGHYSEPLVVVTHVNNSVALIRKPQLLCNIMPLMVIQHHAPSLRQTLSALFTTRSAVLCYR